MVTQLPSPKEPHPPNFGPYLLRPNGCMDQDVTWYGAIGLGPGDFVLDGDATLPSPKRGRSPPPQKKIGPCLLWLSGWMDEAGTWHRARPQPRGLCVRWAPSPPPQFSTHFYCGQTAGCIKMPFGMDVGLSPVNSVLDGDPVPLYKKGAEPQIFGPCLLWLNGWMDQDATWHQGRPQSR